VASRTGLDEFGKTVGLGWIGLEAGRLRAQIGVPDADAPAHGAGLLSADRVVSLAGQPIEDWEGFAAAYAAAGTSGEITIEVERGAPESPPIALQVPALGSTAALGVVPARVVIAGVKADAPADRGGLEAGDVVLALDGAPVASFAAFAEAIRTSDGRALQLEVARGDRTRAVEIVPELTPYELGMGIEDRRYMVGVTGQPPLPGSVALDKVRNPVVALPRAVGMTVDLTRTFLRGLVKLVTGEVSRKQLAGPIGIAQLAGDAYRRGWESYLTVMVLISINLGILNLLPVPILDGGQALVFIIEGIKRGPLSLRTREVVQQLGLTVLVLLMGLAFWNDISRNWSRVIDWLRSGTGL
jgi:regulator of sigma E protease